MNTEMVDIKGRKIKSGDNVRIYQRAQSMFQFYTCKNEQGLKDNIKWIQTLYNKNKYFPNGEYTLKRFKGNEYIVYLNGKIFGLDSPEFIYEKTPFMMGSEHEIPEMNIKKGEKVLCFGGEGYAAGVFRYDANNMEVISKV